MSLILTGASRGIGRALARALPASMHVHAIARDAAALGDLARERPNTTTHILDLASRRDATHLGTALATGVEGPITLVHAAGIWPSRCELVDGIERAFLVNCLSPLALQQPLLQSGKLSRVLAVGAGLMIKGAFDAERTPVGADFSWFRTYCSTKLAFACAMRDIAREHRSLDVAVVHPGVVRTDLGARDGLLGRILDWVKRGWEDPDTCGRRLARLLARPQGASPGAGDARWFVEELEQPWPHVVDRDAAAVRAALGRFARPGPRLRP